MRRILLASLVLAFAFSKLAFSASAADTTPPTLLSAVRHSTNLFEIFLTFSERMDTNTTLDVASYQVKSGTTTLPINDVYTPGNQKLTTNVIISVGAELAMNKDWVVIVKDVADTNANAIVTSTNIINTVEELLISVLPGISPTVAPSMRRTQSSTTIPGPQPDPDFYLNFDNVTPFYRGWTPSGVATAVCCWNNVTDTEYTSSAYYYRAWVPITGSLFNGTLDMRINAADGAVVYVNGKEIYRTNIAATVLQPVYTTLASGTGSAAKLAATGGRVIRLSPGSFKPGDNLVAVEVHSRSKISTISGFDFELIHRYTNRLTGPIKITRQPQEITVVEGTSAKFDVEHEGNPPYKYEWSKGATKIVGATNRILNLNLVTLADNNSTYSVKISGGSGATTAVTSSNAVLHVIADTNAPTIVSALLDDAAANITIAFSERMKVPAATTVANYVITNLAGQVFGIDSITNADDSFTAFTIVPSVPLKASTRYFIVPSNLTDNAAKANSLAAGSAVSVGGTFSVVEMESPWKYYVEGTNPPVAGTWTQPSYNDSTWDNGNSLFGFDDAVLPLPFSTALPTTDPNGDRLITYYFRRTFEGGGPTNGMTMVLSHITDDGMIIYLNGQIAYRFNLTTASPKYSNFATTEVGDAVLIENIKFPITNLVAGVNQLAVELHQSTATSGDAAFAIQLDQTIPSVVVTNAPVNAKPTVTITSPASGSAANTGLAVNLAATATDTDGTVAKVEFFDGTTKLGEDTTSPYTFSWTPATAGSHTIKAVATDNGGATGEASVTVTVTDPPTPKLTIVKSADGKTALISWTATPGFALQSATKLAPTADWTAVANAGASSYTATLSAGSPRYYRLLKP